MSIRVGDIVYLRAYDYEHTTHYEVLEVDGDRVTKVMVHKVPKHNSKNYGDVMECNVMMNELEISGPPLTPKELVCRKILQLEERFKIRPLHKIEQQVEQTRTTADVIAEAIRRHASQINE